MCRRQASPGRNIEAEVARDAALVEIVALTGFGCHSLDSFGDRLLNLEIEKEFAPAPASWGFEVE